MEWNFFPSETCTVKMPMGDNVTPSMEVFMMSMNYTFANVFSNL
jgi:hypothetical protein